MKHFLDVMVGDAAARHQRRRVADRDVEEVLHRQNDRIVDPSSTVLFVVMVTGFS